MTLKAGMLELDAPATVMARRVERANLRMVEVDGGGREKDFVLRGSFLWSLKDKKVPRIPQKFATFSHAPDLVKRLFFLFVFLGGGQNTAYHSY